MYEDRNSKKSQEGVIADILRDRYIEYYRSLDKKLHTPKTPDTVTPTNPTTPVVEKPKTRTEDFNLIPGYTVSHTYALAGLEDDLKSPQSLICLGLLGTVLYFASKGR